jgi:hypothetical protein
VQSKSDKKVGGEISSSMTSDEVEKKVSQSPSKQEEHNI